MVSETTPLTVGIYGTLVMASITLFIGRLLIERIRFMQRFTIPSPVAGGLVVATLLLILHLIFKFEVSFDRNLQTGLMLAFFATIGLNANIASLKAGGRPLFIFLFVVVGLLIIQNSVGVGLAKLMGIDPLVGLLSSSITLSGGHSTGGAWAEVFANDYNLPRAYEIAMACATFGLILGGLIGGPVAQFLLRREKQRPLSEQRAEEDASSQSPEPKGFEAPLFRRPITANALLETIAMIAVALFIGTFLADNFGQIRWDGGEKSLTIPPFVFVLFVGAFINNLLSLTTRYVIFERSISLLGNVSLSLFLAMALMSLKLWELASLAIPIFTILIAQTIVMALYAIFVTYPVMGRNRDAAVLAAGHCGFGMGATPTAVANMQAITQRYGPSRIAFLIVPMVGAFFIDIANAIVINIFIALPF